MPTTSPYALSHETPPTILIADDDPIMRAMLVRLFTHDGYKVIQAENGADAVTLFDIYQPHIVLLDGVMPVLDGFKTCTRLRALPAIGYTPILVITALSDTESVNQAFAAGATDYISKPVQWNVLRQRVRYLILGAQAEAARARSEATQRAIFNSITQGIILISPSWEILTFNSIAHDHIFRLWNMTIHEGTNLQNLIPEDKKWFIPEVNAALRGEFIRCEQQIVDLYGTYSWWDITYSPVHDAADGILGACISALDITERKQTEEKIRHVQKIEAMGRLAGSVAHEFNSQLTRITGYSDLLLHSFATGDPRARHAAEIRTAAARAANITDQLIAVSGAQILRVAACDVNTLIRDALADVPFQVTTLFAALPLFVHADADYIGQAIRTLAQYTAEQTHGCTLTVSISSDALNESAQHDSAYVCIEMRCDDSVSPLQPLDLVHSDLTVAGTGIDVLAACSIIQHSGGNVLRGTGRTLIILSQDSVLIQATPTAQHNTITTTPTILVVDDDPSILQLTETILLRKGYTVLTAHTGIEALAVSDAYDGVISLIVTDVLMPRMSGRELADEMTLRRPDIGILFVSGYTDNILSSADMQAGRRSFLSKPFTLNELTNAVEALLSAPVAS